MTHIVVSRVIGAPRQAVWERLSDLASHSAWMRDARSIRLTGEPRRGVGARMEVETRLGPFRTLDVLEVTAWDEGRSLSVAHRGVIEGRGIISVEEHDLGCRVAWDEELAFPWWLGGRLGELLARPILEATMRGNLQRLESLLSSP